MTIDLSPRGLKNITIVGAGAMGSFFGGLLAESGNDVTLIDVNDAHIGAISANGLRLETENGDRQVRSLRVCRPEGASDLPQLLVVFTKTLHTAAALSGVRHLIGPDVHVLSLQNGLGNGEKITEFVSPERILIGVTTWPADMVAPGHVHSHGKGVVRLMAADGVSRPIVWQVTETLSAAGLACTSDSTVWAAIWEKVAFNAALNSICAVSGCTVDQLGLVPDGKRLADEVVVEVLSVAQRLGIEVKMNELSWPGRDTSTVTFSIFLSLHFRPLFRVRMNFPRTNESSASTFPYIQVRNAGARVEHEASTSKIGEDQLFYFAQRGIGAEDAVSMIINGFCKDVFRQLPMEFAVEATKLLGLKLEGSVG